LIGHFFLKDSDLALHRCLFVHFTLLFINIKRNPRIFLAEVLKNVEIGYFKDILALTKNNTLLKWDILSFLKSKRCLGATILIASC